MTAVKKSQVGNQNLKSIKTKAKKAETVKRKRRQNVIKDSKLSIAGVFFIVAVFCTVMIIKTIDGKDELYQLEARENKLAKEYEQEQQKSEELEEERAYVQTKMYVEEMAKKLGLVYPDEIIYKPN